MWIDANERKPGTARKVFVRGVDRASGVNRVVIANWHEFDNRWSNFIIIDNEYHTPDLTEITHWMEIDSLVTLPTPDTVQEEKARLFTHNTITIRTFQSYSGIWYANFVHWNNTITRPVGTGLTEMLAVINLCEQEQQSLDSFIESLVGEDDNG